MTDLRIDTECLLSRLQVLGTIGRDAAEAFHPPGWLGHRLSRTPRADDETHLPTRARSPTFEHVSGFLWSPVQEDSRMNRRGFLCAGFAAAIGTVMAPSVASASGIGAAGPRLPETLLRGRDGITGDDLLVPAQAGPPRGRRRRRCRVVQRRVAYRDRSGRIRYRMVSREICN